LNPKLDKLTLPTLGFARVLLVACLYFDRGVMSIRVGVGGRVHSFVVASSCISVLIVVVYIMIVVARRFVRCGRVVIIWWVCSV